LPSPKSQVSVIPHKEIFDGVAVNVTVSGGCPYKGVAESWINGVAVCASEKKGAKSNPIKISE